MSGQGPEQNRDDPGDEVGAAHEAARPHWRRGPEDLGRAPAGFAVRRFETLPSTNTYLMQEARAGAPAGTVAVADHQSAGRGRLDRRWEAPPGTALLVSVLLRPVLRLEQLHLVTGAAALAGADACRSVAGVEAGLKWPNDLVVRGSAPPGTDAKLAGILAEVDGAAPGGPPGSVAVVVGLGLNLTWSGPPGSGGTSLEASGASCVNRDLVLVAFLDGLARRMQALGSPDGRDATVAELRRRTVTIGRRVRVQLGGGRLPIFGTVVGLTNSGHLLVERDPGSGGADGPAVVEVVAGDVVHLRDEQAEPELPR